MINRIENTLGLLIYKSQKYSDIELSEKIIDLFMVLRTLVTDQNEMLSMWRKYVETVQIKNYLDNFVDEWDYADYFTRHEVEDIEAWNKLEK